MTRDMGVLAAGGGLAGLPLDPLPDLRLAVGVDEDDQMLEGPLGDLALYLAPDRVLGNGSVPTGVALVDGEPGFLRDRRQGVFVVVHDNGRRLGLVVVPTQALHEKPREVEGL